jgi:hypothetical protein
MAEIKGIFKFFTECVSGKNPAIRRTIEKVEFYDEEDQSLTEKADEFDEVNMPISAASDATEVSVAEKVKCYIFIRAPQQKSLKVKPVAPNLDKAD